MGTVEGLGGPSGLLGDLDISIASGRGMIPIESIRHRDATDDETEILGSLRKSCYFCRYGLIYAGLGRM
jgi:hypothetical protein